MPNPVPSAAPATLSGVARLLLNTALLVFVFSLPDSLRLLAALLRTLC